jgi:hypothetical protein
MKARLLKKAAEYVPSEMTRLCLSLEEFLKGEGLKVEATPNTSAPYLNADETKNNLEDYWELTVEFHDTRDNGTNIKMNGKPDLMDKYMVDWLLANGFHKKQDGIPMWGFKSSEIWFKSKGEA